MISVSALKQICEEYGINAEKLINNNSNILEYGEVGSIYSVLEFLKGISESSFQHLKKTYGPLVDTYDGGRRCTR